MPPRPTLRVRPRPVPDGDAVTAAPPVPSLRDARPPTTAPFDTVPPRGGAPLAGDADLLDPDLLDPDLLDPDLLDPDRINPDRIDAEPLDAEPLDADLTAADLIHPFGEPGRRVGHRRLRPGWVAALAVGCLAVGAVGGSSWSRQGAQQQLDAGTHVFLWTDGTQVSDPSLPDGSVVVATRLRVTLMATGTPVILQRVLLGAGQGESAAGVTLLPGVETTADLDLRPDCAAFSRDGEGVVARLGQQRAVVRPAGSQRSREVPLDVLADSSALMLSLVSPCTSATAPQTSAEGLQTSPEGLVPGAVASAPAPSPALTVVGLAAGPTGRLTFTLRARGTATTRFSLPLAATVGSRARFTVRSRPALPITVRPGTAVRVTVDVTAACRSHTGSLPPTYGLLLPAAQLGGTSPARAEVPLEGWDDGVAAAALTAAALRGCR